MTIGSPVESVRALKVRPGHRVEMPEHVVTEEPLEIRIAGPRQDADPVVVTMRTPGDDFELAAGFVCSERLTYPSRIAAVGYCDAVRDDPDLRYNTVTVSLRHIWVPSGMPRLFGASASCGVCGKASIDEIALDCDVVAPGPPLPGTVVSAMPDRLRSTQKAFDRTGGLHAAGLFDAAGDLLCAREDVGRHNAVDKVIGCQVLKGVFRTADAGTDGPGAKPAGCGLMVSGRVSFEIVQKAAVAGIGAVCAVSAPTSLAVKLANRLGVGLACFVRGGSFNVYTHPERFDFDS
jgi:FdhD protein